MADNESPTPGNGAGDPHAATIAQYIKDLSVESPNSPTVFQWQDQPQVDVQFNINVDRIAEEVHEVVIKIEVSARSANGIHFIIDLSYAGLFGLRNIPEDALPPFLLVEAPRLLFPFARQIIADATQQTGFPPLMLDPIDFGAAYMAQIEAAQGHTAKGEGNGKSKGKGKGKASDAGGEVPGAKDPPQDPES